MQVKHVIILIHGIRDLGGWHQPVEQVIGSNTVRIVAPRYGWFPPCRFIAPWDTSKGPIERVYQQLVAARRAFPKAKISVIAHSFGTHLLTKILLKHPEILIHRIILCGSVIKQDFEWQRVAEQIGDSNDSDKAKFIVNDCGNRDIWPIIGASAGWRYGNAGTDGIGSVYVRDRFHNGDHSLFFNKKFIDTYWKPFIIDGQFKAGTAIQGEDVPRSVRLFTRLPLRYLQILLPIIGLVTAYIIWAMSNQPELTDIKTFKDFTTTLSKKTKNAVKLRSFKDEAENKRFKGWKACIVKPDPDDGAYTIWWEDIRKEPSESTIKSLDGGNRVRIDAYFPDGRYNKDAEAGDWIKFDGVIENIEVDNVLSPGTTVLGNCLLVTPP